MNAGQAAPWGLAEVRTTFLTAAVGTGTLLVAWWGSSGTGKLDRQVTWMVVAIAGVVVIGVGNFLWLLAARRAVGTRRAEVLAALGGDDTPVSTAAAVGDPLADTATTVVLDGSPRYHRPTCLLVRGKPTRSAVDVDFGGLQPCEMCEP